MSLDQEVEILRKIPLFTKVDPAKLKLMAFASERMSFKKGQSLFHQGDVGDSAFIVVEGKAEVIINTNTDPLVVARIGKNDIVGEIAILCDIPRTATVTAVEPMVTLKLTKDLFFRMLTDFPEIGIEVMRVLAHRLEVTTAQLREKKS
jgi:CRP/FNR family cyclic AMP-dependent transcriptional regulator